MERKEDTMNKYAELKYGKVVCVQEHVSSYSDFISFFSPTCYWVDVTGQEVNVGDVVSFKEGIGLVFTAPPQQTLTLETAKLQRIALMKKIRDQREVALIDYKGKLFDYDDKSRERLRIAEKALIDNNLPSQEWTCADNTKTELTVADFKIINTLAAQRSAILHERYNALKELINNCLTIEEVEAITFDSETTIE